MALTNALKNFSTIGSNFVRSYVIPTAEIAALGAFTTGDVTIATLPAGAIVREFRLKHTASVTGGTLSAVTARGLTSNTNYGGAALDVFQAPSNTALTTDVTPRPENFATTTDLKVHFVSTGDNLAAATAGSVTVWLNYAILA